MAFGLWPTLLLLLPFFQLSNALNSDGEALLALSSRLILPRSVNSTWNSSDPSPCRWAGIGCDRSGFVTSFELPRLRISGSLGKEIGSLSRLRKLNLSANVLSGLVPSELGNCTLLEYLDLSNNSLSGEIPVTLQNLEKLSSLLLYNNSLSGNIPSLLFQRSSLETIYLNDNNLDGSIPPFDENACRVKFLCLGQNNLSGTLPASISNCSELEQLYLYANHLTGPIPRTIHDLTEIDVHQNDLVGNIPFNSKTICKLESLVMSSNRFDGELPAALGNCSNLKYLAIVDNHLSGTIPSALGLLTKLEILYLSNNSLSGPIPSEIGQCQSLISLYLSENPLEGIVPRELGNLRNLKNLSLFSNNLTGEFPIEIWTIPNLTNIFISTNNFSGQLPMEMCELKNLTIIYIFENRFTGVIPQCLGINSSLVNVVLTNNSLVGRIPSDICFRNQLMFLKMSNNMLNGAIPPGVGNCSSLQRLSLGDNNLSGSIPEFFATPNLLYINLSFNKLSGQIPQTLGNIVNVTDINLSANKLDGPIPRQIGNLANLQRLNLSKNNLYGFSGSLPRGLFKFVESSPSSFTGNPQLCISCRTGDSICTNITVLEQCSVPNNNSEGLSNIRIVIMALASGLLCALVLFVVGFFFLKCKRKIDDIPSLHEGSSFLLKKVIEATEDFNQKYEIGRGAHGIVYKAALDAGKIYAIKKITFPRQKRSNSSMIREIQIIQNIKHRNLVKLEKFWFELEYGLLLYEYMANGSLHDILHEIKPAPVLEWKVRYKIAVGVARGLDYLHNDCIPAIIHRDIKPKNILLDADMEPHISDFGIAKHDQHSTQSTAIMGTLGYIAPETAYMTRKSKDSDVYSFGVVLLELITRKMAIDPSFSENMDMVGWVTSTLDGTGKIEAVMDEDLANEVTGTSEMEEANKVLSLAMRCVAREASMRPSMQNAVRELLDIKSRFADSQKHRIS